MRRIIVAAASIAVTLIAFAGPASAATGAQSFMLVQSTSNSSLFASGPISGSGRDVVLSDTQDRFVFPAGSVFVTHTPTANHGSFSEATCIGRFTERGTYQLTGGTGRYAGASGGGTYLVEVVSQVKRTAAGCTGPETDSVIITANGRTTLP